jgi:hypothetical protein
VESSSDFIRHLKSFLNKDTAFGPEHFGAIGADNLPFFDRLFDSDNKIYTRMSFKTPLVIGRRGSGKSTFLQSRRKSEKQHRQIVVEISSGSIFSAISRKIAEEHADDYVEVIAETWAVVIDLCLLVAIGSDRAVRPPESLQLLANVFNTKYRDSYRKRGTSAPGRLLHYFEDFTREMLVQVKGDVRTWTGKSLNDLRAEAVTHLQRSDRKALCLIDSLEDYKLSKSLHSDALAGLFKCTSEYHAGRSGVMQICASVPSELYSFFAGYISSGVIKDFSNATWLYWHASELLSVCSKRFAGFLNLYGMPGAERLNLRRLQERRESRDFLASFFPSSITSSYGASEEPIAYLLRHTQLIPRQIIAILNQVYKESQSNGHSPGKNSITLFSEQALRDGVERKINEITDDIITGYREKYPRLQVVLDAIVPNLPLHFVDADMDSQFPRHVKVLHKRYPQIEEYAPDSTSLLHTLLDVGIVGRIIDETANYVRAEFAYTIPSRDVGYSAEKDRFCFHPVFAKRFRCIYDRQIHKPVYPIGTDPEVDELV